MENYHLGLIVQAFVNLRHLNVANNSEITNFSALSRLCQSIEVLKLGPKLSVNSKKNRALYNYEMPIEEIVSGNGLNINHLQLQGCLTPKLTQLEQLTRLDHLVIKYASFSSVEDIFSLEVEILTSAAAKLKQVRQLDLYQVRNQMTLSTHQFVIVRRSINQAPLTCTGSDNDCPRSPCPPATSHRCPICTHSHFTRSIRSLWLISFVW